MRSLLRQLQALLVSVLRNLVASCQVVGLCLAHNGSGPCLVLKISKALLVLAVPPQDGRQRLREEADIRKGSTWGEGGTSS